MRRLTGLATPGRLASRLSPGSQFRFNRLVTRPVGPDKQRAVGGPEQLVLYRDDKGAPATGRVNRRNRYARTKGAPTARPARVTTLRISCVQANVDFKSKCTTEIEKLKIGRKGRGTSA
ncbi:hypothetical protein NC796_25775 [Aliifodinibius sp. S!AR15-10]|uniref:hypothetical protein n=1 Tax=Aliifodinibius sp. S!AR15-10 TaxID=2950437 RepID=UPI00285D1C5C|nr:hypothetical protein [Aliifodinibius sp. S!AR15-10]MDR8394581.1 hypothetical protein [Aliifodinibius sp. S!AR15-10]